MSKFKIGDRVKIIDTTGDGGAARRMGHAGVVTHVQADSLTCVTMDSDGAEISMYARRFELVSPPLTIEADKYYRTRDGRKVGPMGKAEEWLGGFYDQGCRITGQRWETNGSFIKGQTSNLDLIAEWQETTNVGAQVDALAEEYGPAAKAAVAGNDNAAKPKFKIGDRVKCIDDRGAPADFKVGEFYTVTAVEDGMVSCGDAGMFGYRFELAPAPWSGYAKQTSKFKVGDRVVAVGDESDLGIVAKFAEGRYAVHWQSHGMHPSDTVIWRDEELTLLNPTAIVALIEGGKPKPADIPHVHANQAAAEREAKRLAGVHKGKQFGVYVLATTAEEPAPVYAHEWQRLAADGRRPLAVSSLVRTAGIPQGHAERIVGQFAA